MLLEGTWAFKTLLIKIMMMIRGTDSSVHPTLPQPQTMRWNLRALFETWGTLSTLALHQIWPQSQMSSVPPEIQHIPLSSSSAYTLPTANNPFSTCEVHFLSPAIFLSSTFFWILLLQADWKQAFPSPMYFWRQTLFNVLAEWLITKTEPPLLVLFFMFGAIQTVLTQHGGVNHYVQ